MFTYKVEKDGDVVWEDSSDEYLGDSHFPAEYWGFPASGVVKFLVNDIAIAINTPEV